MMLVLSHLQNTRIWYTPRADCQQKLIQSYTRNSQWLRDYLPMDLKQDRTLISVVSIVSDHPVTTDICC